MIRLIASIFMVGAWFIFAYTGDLERAWFVLAMCGLTLLLYIGDILRDMAETFKKSSADKPAFLQPDFYLAQDEKRKRHD